MAVGAVIFDWGGTLTPWHAIDINELWLAVCTRHYPPEVAARLARAAQAAEADLWLLAEREQRSSTMADLLARAGVEATPALLATYYELWEPHTLTDPAVAPLLITLRERGIRIGVLSNTMWPRSAHERFFRRDNVLDLIDGAVYSSEIDWVKPHPEAFGAAMAAIGVADPGSCVFVGDRPYDDVHGAKRAGMRAVLVPHSDVPGFDGARPDAVLSRLADLPRYLDQWA